MIVICPLNPTPVYTFNRQGSYKKLTQYEKMNHTEVVKAIQDLKNNTNEFWYTYDEIIKKCGFLNGAYYESDYRRNYTQVIPTFSSSSQVVPGLAKPQISVVLEGI